MGEDSRVGVVFKMHNAWCTSKGESRSIPKNRKGITQGTSSKTKTLGFSLPIQPSSRSPKAVKKPAPYGRPPNFFVILGDVRMSGSLQSYGMSQYDIWMFTADGDMLLWHAYGGSLLLSCLPLFQISRLLTEPIHSIERIRNKMSLD